MHREPSFEPDPSRCPLCGASNACAMELERATGQPQGPCWCTQVTFDAGVLARTPVEARGKACLCPSCAARTAA
jgi:hypothetical protein